VLHTQVARHMHREPSMTRPPGNRSVNGLTDNVDANCVCATMHMCALHATRARMGISTIENPNPRSMQKRLKLKTGSLSSCVDVWEVELNGDEDENFILNGVKHGFCIVDDPAIVPEHVCMKNSPTSPEVAKAINNKLVEGIQEGHYKVVNKQPTSVSGLHAIPKPDGDIRLIHDCSRPEGQSVNDYTTKDDRSYQSVEELVDDIKPNWYIGKN
jgi:hypothetical protein